MRTLVGVFGWASYSDHCGLSSSMLHSWREGRYIVGRVQALPRVEVSGIFIQAATNCSTRSLSYSQRQYHWNVFGLRWLSTIHSFMEEVYKQAACGDSFHSLTVVYWLHPSRRNPLHALVARFDQPPNRNKTKQAVLHTLRCAKIRLIVMLWKPSYPTACLLLRPER